MASILSTLRLFLQRRNPGPRSNSPLDVDDDYRWLNPPGDLLSPEAWDQFWNDHLEHGLGPPIFDMFCDERALIAAMSENRMTSILCAGNGISMEPRALATAGFDVVALDISPRALEIAQSFPSDSQLLSGFLDMGSQRPGGHVDYVVGNILDPEICPGPYDVVLERRTAQNYPDGERARMLSALADRLAPQGILFTHCHDARGGRFGKARHVTGQWCREQGWPIWRGAGTKPEGRVAWLFSSTG